jgi:hypothetical protein
LGAKNEYQLLIDKFKIVVLSITIMTHLPDCIYFLYGTGKNKYESILSKYIQDNFDILKLYSRLRRYEKCDFGICPK